MITNDHVFDQATALEQVGENTFAGQPGVQYWNLAGPFGGVTSATLMRAVLLHSERSGTPVSMTTNFCAAVQQQPFEIETNLKRSGKYLQHWTVTMTQGGAVVADATVAIANRQTTWAHQESRAPEAPTWTAIEPLPTHGRTDWVKNYDFRMVDGDISKGVGSADAPAPSLSRFWVADRPRRNLDHVSLAALCDAFFLRIIQVRGALVPMGTVTLTSLFHATETEIDAQGTEPLLGEASAERFNDQFHDQRMRLWGKGGILLASGVQLAWFKE